MDDRESTQDLKDVNWTTLKLQVHRRWTKQVKKRLTPGKKGNNILSLIQYKKKLSLQMERKT